MIPKYQIHTSISCPPGYIVANVYTEFVFHLALNIALGDSWHVTNVIRYQVYYYLGSQFFGT